MNRGVAQLSRVELGYSLLSGASKGVREFVASPLMKQFQAQHPHVSLVARVNSRGFPHAEATYRQHTRTRMDQRMDGRTDRQTSGQVMCIALLCLDSASACAAIAAAGRSADRSVIAVAPPPVTAAVHARAVERLAWPTYAQRPDEMIRRKAAR